jgi:hypothetical protein
VRWERDRERLGDTLRLLLRAAGEDLIGDDRFDEALDRRFYLSKRYDKLTYI